jgi:hypothetical protein
MSQYDYREYKVRYEPPVVRYRSETAQVNSPQLNQELLRKVGLIDPQFAARVAKLDFKPLTEEAVKQALASLKQQMGSLPYGFQARVGSDGSISCSYEYQTSSPAAKQAAQEMKKKFEKELAAESYKIALRLLDYDCSVTRDSSGGIKIEGTKASTGHNVPIVVSDNGKVQVEYNHFAGKQCETESDRINCLLDSMGVTTRVLRSTPKPDKTVSKLNTRLDTKL